MTLLLVNWSQPAPDEKAHSVGLYYSAADGRRFHIWQTNNSRLAELGKDVMAAGTSETIEGRQWKSLELPEQGLHVLNRYFPDGITLSLDGNIEWGELRRVAASIPD
ncbi:MAG: hypothetical protein M3198_16570 [Actinomycetota bacterium]|nr:hypothetical protein [Actinomycetota bacterium]